MRCQRTGCENEGRWQPKLIFPAPRCCVGAEPAQSIVDLHLCDAHTHTATIDDFISDEGWAEIAAFFAARGNVVPARREIVLGWVPAGTFNRLAHDHERGPSDGQ